MYWYEKCLLISDSIWYEKCLLICDFVRSEMCTDIWLLVIWQFGSLWLWEMYSDIWLHVIKEMCFDMWLTVRCVLMSDSLWNVHGYRTHYVLLCHCCCVTSVTVVTSWVSLFLSQYITTLEIKLSKSVSLCLVVVVLCHQCHCVTSLVSFCHFISVICVLVWRHECRCFCHSTSLRWR